MDFCSLGFLSDEIVSKSCDCGSIACCGHGNELNLYVQKQWWGTALYYICNRHELQDILWCYINEIREICGSCEKFSECKKLEEIRERLDNAYFLKKGQTHPSSRCCGKFFYLILETIFIFI